MWHPMRRAYAGIVGYDWLESRSESIMNLHRSRLVPAVSLLRPDWNAMIYNNIVLTVNETADVEAIGKLLAEQGRLSRAEPGCARFEVYHSQTDPKVFLLIERWESSAALDAHRLAKAYTEIYKPQVLPKVTRIAHVSDIIE
jgi:quinol monooxygenase YgiN